MARAFTDKARSLIAARTNETHAAKPPGQTPPTDPVRLLRNQDQSAFKEVSYSESYAKGTHLQLDVGPRKLMTARGTTKEEWGHTRQFEAVQKEPIEVLLDAMKLTDRTLVVLDNFQNVEDDRTRKLVAQTIERFSDRAAETDNTTLVVIGIADDAPGLLGASASSLRRTAQIGVPRMPADELRQILVNGLNLLGLSADPATLDRLVFYSDGFPYFAHLLGQSVAKSARRGRTAAVTMEMVTVALHDATENVDESYRSRTRQALEASGDVQPRKRLLELLAYDDTRLEDERRRDPAVRGERRAPGRQVDKSFLHVALAQLTSDKYGSILKRTGPAGSYMYKFADPHMRPYLRLSTFPRLAEGDGG